MDFLTNMTLKKKIYLLLALGLVIGISVFSFLGIRAVNQATEVMLEDRLTTAHLIAGYLDEILGSALTVLEGVSQAIGDDKTGGNIIAEVEKLEETYNLLSISIRGVYVIDPQGLPVWSQPESPAINVRDISRYASISQALKGGPANISGLVVEPAIDIPVILLASPIRETGVSAVKGALVAVIDISQSSISGFIRTIALGQTGYVEIVDENGYVVMRTESGPKLAPFETSDHSTRFAALIAAGQPTRGLCHTCHEPIQKVERKDVLSFFPLSRASWGVVVRQSETEALAPVFQLRQSLILSGSLFTIFATLIIIFTTRDVINRVKILTAASTRIAEGDLNSAITVAKQDELGLLAGAFENMRTKLKAYYGEIEQKTKVLSYLLSVSEMLSHLPDLSDLDTALGNVLDKTLEIMKEDAGAILLLDEDRQALNCRVNRGFYQENAVQILTQRDDGISSQAVRTGETVAVADISEDSRLVGLEPLAEGLRGLISVPLRSKQRILGVLNIGSRGRRQFSPEDVKLLEGIARQTTAAVENARLHYELQRKEEIRGELLQDMFAIQEEERKRIARELHDETSQVIAGLTASLEATASMIPANAEKPRAILKKAQALSVGMLDSIHKLIYELRPSLLDDMGLVVAARWLAEVNLEATGVAVDFKTSGRQRRLPPRIEVTLFRVIQEAINNIARHSRAKNAGISLQFKKDAIRVKIRDNGQGFDVGEAISSRERPRGLGLVGMTERVAIVGGSMDMQSHPDKKGTEIIIEIPLDREETSDGENKSTDRG